MPLYRSNTPSCSQVEVAALTTEPPESLNLEVQNEDSFAFLKSSTIHKKDPSPLLNKAVKKRGGMGVSAKASESTFSSLLQPILALFPPAQTAVPLAPAFELKLPNSPKITTGKHDNGPLVKAKSLTHVDDEDAFVIYQPASWRSKPTAARMARTFDWRTDVFGPSPNAVYGQRTKYPKPPVPPRLLREFGPVKRHSILLASMVRDRAGSLTSVSDVSSISFASTGEDDMETQPITPPPPPQGEALVNVAPSSREHVTGNIKMEGELLSLDSLASPSGAVVERFSKMGVVSPIMVAVSAREEENIDVMKEETHSGSTPFTPLTPREIPDSDEESDDE